MELLNVDGTVYDPNLWSLHLDTHLAVGSNRSISCRRIHIKMPVNVVQARALLKRDKQALSTLSGFYLTQLVLMNSLFLF